MEYIWRETRSKLVQFIETASDMEEGSTVGSSSQSREWLDFQSIIISLLRTAFTSSAQRGVLFQAMIRTITPASSEEDADEEEGLGGAEKLSELDLWLLLALADAPQYKTKIHTCLIKQVCPHIMNYASSFLLHFIFITGGV